MYIFFNIILNIYIFF